MDKLNQGIYYLFSRYWDAELTEEDEDAIKVVADALLNEFGWAPVFKAVMAYLTQNANSPAKAINAAHIFWELQWYEKPISDPYDFLGFFYYQVNFETEKYDSSDILDSLTTSILPKNGVSAADIYLHPYYMPERDPEMIAAVERWKKKS